MEGLPGEWAERGACRGANTERFYAVDTTVQRDNPNKYGSARRLCLACDVREECLEFALVHNEKYGMWGGLLPFERRRLRRKGTIIYTPDGNKGFRISTDG